MPAQDADSGETWYSDNKEGTYSDMDVIDDYETKYSGVRNFMIKFKVTLKEHDWVHKCYVDVTNKYS